MKTQKRKLLPHHLKQLKGSRFSESQLEIWGYRSIMKKQKLEDLGFLDFQRRVPGILIPFKDPIREKINYQYKPDSPRKGKNGKPVIYETPGDKPLLPDELHQMCWQGIEKENVSQDLAAWLERNFLEIHIWPL